MLYHDICLFSQISECSPKLRTITLSTNTTACPFCLRAKNVKVFRFCIFCVTCFLPFHLSQEINQIINLLLFSQLFIINLLLVWSDACRIIFLFGYKTSLKECYIFRQTMLREILQCQQFSVASIKGNFFGNFYLLGFFKKSRLLFATICAKFIEYLSKWTKFHSIYNIVYVASPNFPVLARCWQTKQTFYVENVIYFFTPANFTQFLLLSKRNSVLNKF